MPLRSLLRALWRRLASNGASDPFQVADEYRRKGMRIGEGTAIYPDVQFGHSGEPDPVVIGSNCVLSGCTIIAHDASTNRALGIRCSIRREVVIEDNCFVGYGAIVLMGVRVGRGSIVGAGAVVTSDVPPHSVVAGNPARVIGSVDDLVQKRRQLAIEHPECFRDLPRETASRPRDLDD